MRHIIDEAKRMITAKAIISAASIGLFIPFAKLLYWVFDTSYLGGFGISPDVYNRPIFSSGFVSSWLVAEAMAPALVIWTGFAIVLFAVLFNINFENSEKPKICELDLNNYRSESRWIKLKRRGIYAFSKSFGWPYFIWASGFVLIIFLLAILVWASRKGAQLAEVQLNVYVAEGLCVDKFNSKNKGCFRVTGIDGNNHFVIANPATHLIYLSRKRKNPMDSDESADSAGRENGYVTTLHIHQKEPDKQYSVQRDYQPGNAIRK